MIQVLNDPGKSPLRPHDHCGWAGGGGGGRGGGEGRGRGISLNKNLVDLRLSQCGL